MKYRAVYSIALLAGLLCMVQGARAQSFSPPWDDPMSGWMAVYDDRAGYEAGPLSAYFGGGDLTGPYALDELVTLTSDYYTFDFLPETNKYYNGGSGGASFWQNGTGDGGKYLECLTYWGKAVTGYENYVAMDFTVNSNTFDTNRYDFEAFIKIVDPSDGSSYAETNLSLSGVTSGSYFLVFTNAAASYAGDPLLAGFRVSGTNANPANAASYGGANITVNNIILSSQKPLPPFDLSILSVNGDVATLQWTGGSSFWFYDIVYKTNLADAFWTPDPANTFIPGADGVQQATSLVPGDAVFYRLEAIGGP